MKSNVSDFLELIESVYIDASIKCVADVSDLRDLDTLRARVKCEGISFLTITLPQFCNDFERSLQRGFVDSTLFRRFKRAKGGFIPAFLQGFTSQLFNRETGKVINHETNSNRISQLSSDIPTVVESVRQICLTFKKVELECTPTRVHLALENYIGIEKTLSNFSLPPRELAKFCQVSRLLWDNMVSGFTTTVCIPKHGPGATAEHISGNRKYVWKRWHDRLEPYFPFIDNGYPLGAVTDDQVFKMVSIVLEEGEEPVRVIAVPKSLKSPRIIAIEPCCMQYVQQGIRDYLYSSIESNWLSGGHINFRDQGINQRLAMTSSLDGLLATIDLSDASDRVPRDLALEMFRGNRDLLDSIDACRSTQARLPDGRIVAPLHKFASMGSSLCFPVEAMYFYTICVMALLDSTNLSYTARNVFDVSRSVYVYGDDLIVPSLQATVVLEYLQKYNCKVNTDKTFVSGSFRESCGVDAFAGYRVTPVYIRQLRPRHKQQGSRLVSYVAAANAFYKKGYWRTAQLLFARVEDVLGSLPYVSSTSEALGRISFLGYESIERWNYRLQRIEINGWCPRAVRRTDGLTGYAALMKCFIKMELGEEETLEHRGSDTSSQDFSSLKLSQGADHLKYTAVHGALALKRRWVLPH